MRRFITSAIYLCIGCLLAGAGALPARADMGIAKPELLLREMVAGMPADAMQEVRVLTATLQPGDATVFHTHRYPVTIYILEGAFTLEMDGREPVTVSAGQSMVEPADVSMTGYNRSATEPMKVVIFYVSAPETPFLDPIK